MESRLKSINRHLADYDSDLFALRDSRGVVQVFRRKPVVSYFTWRGVKLGALSTQQQHILSLTEDWTMQSRGVEWGIAYAQDFSIGRMARRHRVRPLE